MTPTASIENATNVLSTQKFLVKEKLKIKMVTVFLSEKDVRLEKWYYSQMNVCFVKKTEKWIVRKGKGVNQRAKLVKCQTVAAENSIKEAAARNNDEYIYDWKNYWN